MASSRVRNLALDRPSAPPADTLSADTLMELDVRRAPTTASLTAVASRPRRQTAPRQAAAVAAPIVTFSVFLGLALAPMAAATIALWAVGAALITLARIVMLAQAGQALTSSDTPALLGTLDTAARAGFLAIGYLALIFALIALMAGLFGRGWGRLYILPGAAFTATAMALLGVGMMFAAPLASQLPIPPAWLIPLALYALVDAVLVGGVMVDARLTRSPSATGQRRAIRRSPRKAGSALA